MPLAARGVNARRRAAETPAAVVIQRRDGSMALLDVASATLCAFPPGAGEDAVAGEDASADAAEY